MQKLRVLYDLEAVSQATNLARIFAHIFALNCTQECGNFAHDSNSFCSQTVFLQTPYLAFISKLKLHI